VPNNPEPIIERESKSCQADKFFSFIQLERRLCRGSATQDDMAWLQGSLYDPFPQFLGNKYRPSNLHNPIQILLLNSNSIMRDQLYSDFNRRIQAIDPVEMGDCSGL
jgi:hypothetical protein